MSGTYKSFKWLVAHFGPINHLKLSFMIPAYLRSSRPLITSSYTSGFEFFK